MTLIQKFQTKTFKRKSADERLRLVQEAMAQVEIDYIGAASRVQAAVLSRDEDERRRANRAMVSLSVFGDELKALHRAITSEKRNGDWVAQGKARRASGKKVDPVTKS